MIITKITKEITNIVKWHFNAESDEENQAYYWFIVHLKFSEERLFNDTLCRHSNDDEFFYVIWAGYKESFSCTVKILKHIKKNMIMVFQKMKSYTWIFIKKSGKRMELINNIDGLLLSIF